MIVFTVYANKLAILCKCENTARVALIFRTIPDSGKFIMFYKHNFE